MNPANYSSISFPFLGLEVNPIRSISVGPLNIYMYGLIIATGLVLAVMYCLKRSGNAGLTEDSMLDGVLWITPFAIVCARIYYVAFSWSEYKDNLISVLYIWNGGIAIYGSVIGAAIGVAIFCKVKKCSLPALLDIVVLGFLIGQFMGRWGNFFNREAFGATTDSFFRMGLFSTVSQRWEYYHPTFLYESVWNFAGFIALHFLYPRRRYDGQIALGYCFWYGLGRCMIEGLRVDSLYWGPFRVSQVLAGVTCAAAACALLYFRFHPPKAELAAIRLKKAEDAPATD